MPEVREARVVAQAKINLFLRVLAREASGYHQLETLFQRLALGDDVRLRGGVAGRALDCRGADVGPVERNLAWRAATAYAERAGWPDGFAIEIDKRIPVGGGLGGGSADAGAVLRCLDALHPSPLGSAALLAIAATLGADVPFLTAEAPRALAWGRGERMLALPPLPARRAHLACFTEGVSTPAAFGALAELRARDADASAARPILWTPERLARWDDVALVATNDLEAPVFAMREDVAGMRRLFGDVTRELAIQHDVTAGPSPEAASRLDPAPAPDGDTEPIALMSGSGATVFLLTPLGGLHLVFDVRAPDADPAAPAPLEIVTTRTATAVASVAIDGSGPEGRVAGPSSDG